MAAKPFSQMLNKVSPMASRTWFYNQAKGLRDSFTPFSTVKNLDKAGYSRKYVMPGRLYMFQYTAKYKDVLPYYDRFPLVFPFSVYDEGFVGLNMHYLPPVHRAMLMDGLLPHVVKGTPVDPIDVTRIQLSYNLLKNTSRLRYFRPAVHSYLNSHVRSRFILVPPDEWNLALMLPFESFTNKNMKKVFSDTRKALDK